MIQKVNPCQRINLRARGVESRMTETSRASSELKEMKQQKKGLRLIVNVLHTQYDVVKEVLKNHFRCKLSVEEEGEWDLMWMDSGVTSEIVSKLKPYQKINHYNGMSCITRKNHLCRNLMRIRKILPKDYNYFPETWLLPTDWNELKLQFTKKRRTLILKPEALSQGKGIFLINSLEGIPLDQKYVVQRYITRPYLIEGLKFDLRIYVLVYGCDPLRVYLFREGLARLATEEYVQPTSTNMNDLYVHLTNYAINKTNENFVFNTDASKTDVGHKRSLAFVWKYIDEHGGNSTKVKDKIKDCIIKTLCAVQPLLKHSYRSFQGNDNGNNRCFEILGFDIMLDHKLKPWLIEVNHSPSFSTDTPFDHEIKTELIRDALGIVRLDATKRQKYYAKLEERKIRLLKM
jgi:tubulin polyglutamylase TTLL6/13